MDIMTTAEKLARHLNNNGDEPDWYWGALEHTGAASFYDEARTNEADPSYASDVVILSDGDIVVEVSHNPQAGEWSVVDF